MYKEMKPICLTIRFGILACLSEDVRQSLGPSITILLFDLLGVIYPVHTAFRCEDECIENSK